MRRVLVFTCAAALIHLVCVDLVRADVPPPTTTEPSIVLIARSPGDERIVARLRGELASTGCHIVELTSDPGQTNESFVRMATMVSAAAAVRVRPDAGSIDVWVVERAGDAPATVENIAAGGPGPDDRVLALRATEALRARGLRLGRRAPEDPVAKPPPPVEPPTTAAASLPVRERAAPTATGRDVRGLWVELGPASSVSPGGIGPSFDASLSLRLKYASRWSAGGFAAVPLLDQRVGAAEGTTRLSTMLAGAFVDIAIVKSNWELDMGAGIGGAMTRMSGSAQAGYVGATDNVIVVAPFARASAHVEVGAGWRLGAGTVLGAALPGVSVRFAEREVATWGRPLFLLATLGIEVPLLTWTPAH